MPVQLYMSEKIRAKSGGLDIIQFERAQCEGSRGCASRACPAHTRGSLLSYGKSPLVYFRVLEQCNRRPLTAQCAQSLRQWVVQESPHSYPAYFANHDEVHPLIYHAKH